MLFTEQGERQLTKKNQTFDLTSHCLTFLIYEWTTKALLSVGAPGQDVLKPSSFALFFGDTTHLKADQRTAEKILSNTNLFFKWTKYTELVDPLKF